MIVDRNIASDANIGLHKIQGGGLFGTTGNIWYVDPANGGTNNSGTQPSDPLSTVSGALNKVTDANNDVIVLIGNGTGLSEDAITWDKDYTHLVGMAAPTMNARARISASADASSNWFQVSGTGCIFKDIRVGTFIDANVNATLSGSRNAFINVTLQGGGNATAADDAAMRSLVLNGAEENYFFGCTIGLDTIARANVASAELEFKGGAARNTFDNCLFTKQADGVGNLFVKTTGTSAVDRWNRFHDCTWYSFWTNDSDKITAAFDVSSQTATGHFIMSGRQILIGADDWESSASNRLYFEPYTATQGSLGLAINNA